MQVERWDVLEITVKGPGEGNPFVEQNIEGTFTGKNETITTAGFYDGDGVYKVRFMPSFEGEYTYKTTGSFPEAETQGSFTSPATATTTARCGWRTSTTSPTRTECPTTLWAPPATCGPTSPTRSSRRPWRSWTRGTSTRCGSACSPSTTSTTSGTRRRSPMRAPPWTLPA